MRCGSSYGRGTLLLRFIDDFVRPDLNKYGFRGFAFHNLAQLRRLKHLLLIRSLIRDNINFDYFLPD